MNPTVGVFIFFSNVQKEEYIRAIIKKGEEHTESTLSCPEIYPALINLGVCQSSNIF